MIIKNARVFTEDGSFMQGDVVVKDGRFDSVLERTADTDAAADSTQQEIIDASGLIMIPGLVDIHFHGCKGADMCDGTTEALDVVVKELLIEEMGKKHVLIAMEKGNLSVDIAKKENVYVPVVMELVNRDM